MFGNLFIWLSISVVACNIKEVGNRTLLTDVRVNTRVCV